MQAEHRKQSFGSLLGAAALTITAGSAWTTARAETASAPQPQERPVGKPLGTPGIAVPEPPAQAARSEIYRWGTKEEGARASKAASPKARAEAAATATSASAASAAASKPQAAIKKKGAAEKAAD
jgi:hypothetical protein